MTATRPYLPTITPAVREQLLASIERREDGCWDWQGFIGPHGYGRIKLERRGWAAHRVMFAALRGGLDWRLTLDHLCRNRRCVNPDHLEPVEFAENVRRGVGPTAINAAKTHCVAGHPLSGDNVRIYLRDGKFAGRFCRACVRRRSLEYKQRKAAA